MSNKERYSNLTLYPDTLTLYRLITAILKDFWRDKEEKAHVENLKQDCKFMIKGH